MNIDDFLAKVERQKTKDGVNYRPPYPDMRMDPDHPDHIPFMASINRQGGASDIARRSFEDQFMASMEPPRESLETQIRKLALNDPILHAVLSMARSNGLNWLDTLEAMVLTLQSTLEASHRSAVERAAQAEPTGSEQVAMNAAIKEAYLRQHGALRGGKQYSTDEQYQLIFQRGVEFGKEAGRQEVYDETDANHETFVDYQRGIRNDA